MAVTAVQTIAYLSASEAGTAGSTTAGIPSDSFKVGSDASNSSTGVQWDIGTGTAKSVNVIASMQLTLAGSAQTIDLTTLATLLGSKAFAKVRGVMLKSLAAAESGFTVAVGAGASNGWTPFLGGTAPTIIVPPQGTVLLLNPQIAAWVVDSTHKSLKADPGANTVNFVIALIGE